MSWQPIETAPEMKTVLLWAATDIDDAGKIKNWKMDSGWRGLDGVWNWAGLRLKVYDMKPTHWQPMPDPPEVKP